MTNGSVFVLDSNVFIQAKRHYYAFDLAPKFWTSLIQQISTGQVRSIDRVKHELRRGRDNLTTWVNGAGSNAFLPTTGPQVQQAFGALMTWVNGQPQFTPAAKAEFASVADGWLVAHCQVNNHVVVTLEVENPDIKKKVPIPNVCRAFNVQFINTFEMLRRLGVQFA